MLRTWWNKYPILQDRDWIIQCLKDGKTRGDIAEMVGCSRDALQKATEFHKIPRYLAFVKDKELADRLDKINH